MNIIMKYLEGITTRTYSVGDGFMVDVVNVKGKSVDVYDAYLYHEDYIIKMSMFRVSTESEDEFISYVRAALEKGAYIQDYKEKYMK